MSTRKLAQLVAAGALIVLSFHGLAQHNAKSASLVIYGPSGPSPAVNEAAVVFSARHGVDIDVRSGPIDSWIERAAEDADLIYSSAQFMMSRFLRSEALKLVPESVRPLYIRPSVVLVRPDNPKNIQDFPDLLRPGVRVMVVEGSGQTGLWEDMAGKLGSLETLRTLRKNISYCAPTSDDAMVVWKTRDDIDVWITWNIWHMPLRDRAKLIVVSPEYRIYRQCSIALTARSNANPLASSFMEFLASPEGADIFASWGWLTTEPDARPVVRGTDIAAVCRVDRDKWKNGLGEGLLDVRAVLNDYERIGIPTEEVHISAVFDGAAAYWLLRDGAYAIVRPQEKYNPNKAIVDELIKMGVRLEMCGKTMQQNGWKESDLLPGVVLVPAAHPRIIDLQLQGYAYIRF
jgi:accessory colonization factor AcfC